MQGNETPYNHNADTMSEAIGINIPKFKERVDEYNKVHQDRMVPSEIVESLESFFTPRELAFMFWNETSEHNATLVGNREETSHPE